MDSGLPLDATELDPEGSRIVRPAKNEPVVTCQKTQVLGDDGVKGHRFVPLPLVVTRPRDEHPLVEVHIFPTDRQKFLDAEAGHVGRDDDGPPPFWSGVLLPVRAGHRREVTGRSVAQLEVFGRDEPGEFLGFTDHADLRQVREIAPRMGTLQGCFQVPEVLVDRRRGDTALGLLALVVSAAGDELVDGLGGDGLDAVRLDMPLKGIESSLDADA